MKIIRITTNYKDYVEKFYDKNPTLKTLPSHKQLQTIQDDCYAWANFWSDAFAPIGYEVWEPISNAEYIQKTWAKEHDITFDEEHWILDITLAQIRYYKPDIVFVSDIFTFDHEFIKKIREECSSVKFIFGWCAAPHKKMEVFKELDLIISSIPSYVSEFRDAGAKSNYVKHAFSPKILDHIKNNTKQTIPVSFIGQIILRKNFHIYREEVLKKLLTFCDISIWSEPKQITKRDMRYLTLKQFVFYFSKLLNSNKIGMKLLSSIPKLQNYSELEYCPGCEPRISKYILEVSKPSIYGIDMYKILQRSKITLNVHGDNSLEFASNMRLYEATGVGCCLLTDNQNNLNEIFEPEKEVVTFKNPEEASEKIRYLLDNETVRNAIALAGQKRTLRDHTFKNRAIEIHDIIRFFL
jgi:spore maturation protein CgeB